MEQQANTLFNNQIFQRLRLKKKTGPKSEKAYWQQQCADLLDVPFMVVFGKTKDLPVEWIHQFYDEAQVPQTLLGKQKRLWQLIRDSRVHTTKKYL